MAKNIWPLERDVLFRPDRLRYVRKLIRPEGCVFCLSHEREMDVESLCVYRSKHSMVIVNKYPYNSGHLLVLPRRHSGDLLELSQDEYRDLTEVLRLSMNALQDVYSPGGMNVGLNHGAVSGAGIPGHLHFHIVPRWAGDLNFFPLIAETKVVIEEVADTWTRLRDWFSQHQGKKA